MRALVVEVDPLEIACTLVVSASAGVDLFDGLFPSICKDPDLVDFDLNDALSAATLIASVAALLAEEMLSLATSVIGAAFLGQLRYQDCLGSEK